jgi:hypothetical protein
MQPERVSGRQRAEVLPLATTTAADAQNMRIHDLKMSQMRSVAANVQLLFHEGFSTNSSILALSIARFAPAPIPAVEPTREKRRVSLSGWIVVDTC